MLTLGISQQHLDEIYQDPYITSPFHDNMQHQPVFVPNSFYLSAWVNDEFAGAFLMFKYSEAEMEVHSLLKRSFVKKTRTLGKELIKWVFDFEHVLRLSTYIPSDMPSVMNYVEKIGFIPEGIKREVSTKNGSFINNHIYGITRTDYRSTK